MSRTLLRSSKNPKVFKPVSKLGNGISLRSRQSAIQPKSNVPLVIQRKCDIKEAHYYYRRTRRGRKHKYKRGLVWELYKVVGRKETALYREAIKEGKIGPSFIRLVCKAQDVLGTGVDGQIGTKTIKAWEKWKTGGKKGIDYSKLFKDRKIEIGIAVGAERHSRVLKIEKFLLKRSFVKSGPKHNPRYKKTKLYKLPGNNLAPPVPIEIIIEMISEKSTDAKKKFGQFLTKKEITFYSGHARYGTGPDFDAKKSPAENFVIGVNSALHRAGRLKKGYDRKMNKVLKKRKNDLEALSKAGKFNRKLYQVWFLDACSTIHYLDEIRGGLVRGKNKSNLRVFGSHKSIYGDPLPIIEGILDMKSMEEIIKTKQKRQEAIMKKKKKKPSKNLYFAN